MPYNGYHFNFFSTQKLCIRTSKKQKCNIEYWISCNFHNNPYSRKAITYTKYSWPPQPSLPLPGSLDVSWDMCSWGSGSHLSSSSYCLAPYLPQHPAHFIMSENNRLILNPDQRTPGDVIHKEQEYLAQSRWQISRRTKP